MENRKEKLGEAENLPLFLHESGHIFSKQELNENLSMLLSRYQELSSKGINGAVTASGREFQPSYPCSVSVKKTYRVGEGGTGTHT